MPYPARVSALSCIEIRQGAAHYPQGVAGSFLVCIFRLWQRPSALSYEKTIAPGTFARSIRSLTSLETCMAGAEVRKSCWTVMATGSLERSEGCSPRKN